MITSMNEFNKSEKILHLKCFKYFFSIFDTLDPFFIKHNISEMKFYLQEKLWKIDLFSNFRFLTQDRLWSITGSSPCLQWSIRSSHMWFDHLKTLRNFNPKQTKNGTI